MNDSNQHSSDKKWVEGILRGDEEAYKKLFLKYYEPLCNFVWRYTRSKVIAEDLVQNVFTNLWSLRTTLDSHRSIRVYLYQAVKNEALDYIKHEKVVRGSAVHIARIKERNVRQKKNQPEEKEFIAAARKAIDNLPDRARQVYKLHREDGLTYREIAEVMDISVKTVESQMTRALNILRNQLRSYLPLQVTENTLAKIFQ